MSYTGKVLWTVWELDVEDYEILFSHFFGLTHQLIRESGRATPGSSNAVTENSIPGLSGWSRGRTAIMDW